MSRRSKARVALYPYKSQFEKTFSELYPKLQYETDKLKYTVEHTYNPDWTSKPGVYFETKGLMTSADRAKHLHIKRQHPDVVVYLIFQNPGIKLSKVSHTTYGEWADKHDIPWATMETIPKAWLK